MSYPEPFQTAIGQLIGLRTPFSHQHGFAQNQTADAKARSLVTEQEEFNNPQSRRVTSGLVADVATDPELADLYLREYASPRRESVWRELQRGVDRGELRADVDFAFVSDLLIGPLFMRSVVWGQPLEPRMAKMTVDVVMAAFSS